MSNYVYRCTEPGTWEVGYFDTWGNWIMESDHDTKEYAREHAYYLNGGNCNQDCNCNQGNKLSSVAMFAELRKHPYIIQQAFPDKVLIDRAQYERMRAFVLRTFEMLPCPPHTFNKVSDFILDMQKICATYARGETP